jgi:hypothetical protein
MPAGGNARGRRVQVANRIGPFRFLICTLVSVCALAVPASPAAAAYYPFAPRAFVDKSRLVGWELCFSGSYKDTSRPNLGDVLAPCDGDRLLLAGGPTGSPTLTVLAAAPRADVIFDTGTSNDPHNANGSGWYFSPDYSWGFAKQGDPIFRFLCDSLDTPNPGLRLCWHTGGGDLFAGWRAGAATSLEDDSAEDYTRYIYQGTPVLSIRVKPSTQAVEAGKVASYRARVTNTGNSTANGLRVCVKPKNAEGALSPSTKTCKGVGELAAGAKATQEFKLKAKAKAAGRKFKLKFTAAGGGLETAARQAKLTVKAT